MGGEEAGDATAVVVAGGGGGGGGLGAGVGLAAGAGALVEEGTVDLGDDEVVGAAEVEGGGGAEREGVELRLGEGGDVDVGERVRLESRRGGGRGRENRRRHFRRPQTEGRWVAEKILSLDIRITGHCIYLLIRPLH